MEGADQVLATRVIDGGLAAHSRIHLRQQRRRHLHERHAALVAGRGETGQVADHAAAEGEHRAVAPEAVGDQDIEHARGVGERLVGLAVRQYDFQRAPRAQASAQRPQVQRRDGRIADDEHVAGARAPHTLPDGR